jgi:hypothetical protein
MRLTALLFDPPRHAPHLLGRDDVYHGDVQNRRPMRQLPFLALSILQPAWGLEGGTHFGVMPESSTQQEFLKRRLWRNL